MLHTLTRNIGAIIICLCFLSACAVSYTDEDGNHRVIGLVNMKLDRPPDSNLIAGDAVTVKNLGMMALSHPQHTGFSLGYNRETIQILKNNVSTFPEHKPYDGDGQ